MPCHLIEHKDNFNFLPNINRKIKSGRIIWAGNVMHIVEIKNTYKILVGKPGKKRSLGRHRRRWEDNITMNIERNRVGGCGMDSSGTR
jgi:hypothetical protein